MRLRNIPGAKDAILECDWVIDEPERFKGKWESVFGEDVYKRQHQDGW